MNLKDKIAIVTGGSSGIGKAISIALFREGCRVVFTYNSNEKGADATLKELGENGFKIKVDLREENDIKDLFAFVKEKFGKLDILINNGGKTLGGEILDLKLWREVFDISLFPIVSCTEKAIKLMKNGGKIFNVSSIYGEEKAGWKGLVAFNSAKAGLNSFTRTMAKNLPSDIQINAIAPGYVKTPLWGELTDEKTKSLSSDGFIGRMIEPEEIAQMAIAIIKNDAMTGEVVVVDGGLSLKTV